MNFYAEGLWPDNEVSIPFSHNKLVMLFRDIGMLL